MSKSQPLSVDRWHARFVQQARWTEQVRSFVSTQLGLGSAARLLEVGCGTGVITSDFTARTRAVVHGLDINPAYLRQAQSLLVGGEYTCGDAFHLPYPRGAFDAGLCHYLLLWLPDPVEALQEMRRVVRKGGWVIVLAEPDYDARIDYPDSLAALGRAQRDALAAQGAEPSLGRTIAHLLVQAGCSEVHSGLTGGQWGAQPDAAQLQSEWEVLRADLQDWLPSTALDEMEHTDRYAWEQGYRVLFVPTFYAWGRVG